MALEFTRLSDVTLVEEATDTANVLIEEDGEIKRVPKTEVGGGNTEWDAVINLGETIDAENEVILELGSYNDIKEKLDSNILPNVLLKAELEYGDVYYHNTKAFEVTYVDSGVILIKALISMYHGNSPTLVIIQLQSDGAPFIWNARNLQ